MNKLFVFLSVLLCLVNSQSNGQKHGTVVWSRLVNPSPYADSIHSIRALSDGKIVVAGNTYEGLSMAIGIGRFDGIGLRDSSFGVNGIVTLSLDSAYTVANAMEIQTDGKIIVAGSYYKKWPVLDFLLARFTPNGSLDSSFGINGIVLTDIDSSSSDVAKTLAVQADGKIVAAGWSGSSLALCRYNTDGSPDSSFDSDGRLTVAAIGFTSIAGASSVKLQRDGKIVVCCRSLVIRFKPDGSLDSGFGTNGLATLPNSGYDMAIQDDGKIVVAGSGFLLERLDTAGAFDNSFGTGGIVTTPRIYTGPTSNYQFATSVCLQRDGRILASGWTGVSLGQYHEFAVARYQSNGALDSSFGTLGSLHGAPSSSHEVTSFSAAVKPDNELVIAGVNVDYSIVTWALESYYLGPPLAVPKAPDVDGQIIVVPNPAEDFARIHSAHIANGNWHLSLCDLTGRTLLSETVMVTNNAFDKSISLVNLPAAIYLVKLDNGTSSIKVKLTKNR